MLTQARLQRDTSGVAMVSSGGGSRCRVWMLGTTATAGAFVQRLGTCRFHGVQRIGGDHALDLHHPLPGRTLRNNVPKGDRSPFGTLPKLRRKRLNAVGRRWFLKGGRCCASQPVCEKDRDVVQRVTYVLVASEGHPLQCHWSSQIEDGCCPKILPCFQVRFTMSPHLPRWRGPERPGRRSCGTQACGMSALYDTEVLPRG